MVINLQLKQVGIGNANGQLADVEDIGVLKLAGWVVVTVEVVAQTVQPLMPTAYSIRVDHGDHLEHEIVPQVVRLEAVQPQQLLHEPNERPLPCDFTWVHSGTDQTLLFVLEHPRVIVRYITALRVEILTFIVHILPWCDCNTLNISTFLTFT